MQRADINFVNLNIIFFVTFTPCSQNNKSLSEREQNSSSDNVVRLGHLKPRLSHYTVAFHYLELFCASLVITKSVKASASGPFTLICLSTAMLHGNSIYQRIVLDHCSTILRLYISSGMINAVIYGCSPAPSLMR